MALHLEASLAREGYSRVALLLVIVDWFWDWEATLGLGLERLKNHRYSKKLSNNR